MIPHYEAFMLARDELCARIVESRASRFGRHIKGSQFSDDSTMINADMVMDDTPPLIFHLIYKDANSALTGRSFKLLRLGGNGNDIAVGGICFMRHAYRNFRASRLVEITDLSTGELFEDGVEYFAKHPLLGSGDGRAKTEEEKAIRHVRDELVVLSYIAACDGEIHDLEMEAIVAFVINSWDHQLDERIVAARARSFVPDSAAFLNAVDRLAKRQNNPRALVRAIRAVVDADRKLHANEQAFAHYIISRIQGTA